MTVQAPFFPAYTQGQTVSPGATSAVITIGLGAKQLVYTNLGANVCYVRAGDAGIAATVNDFPIPPGAQINNGKSSRHDTLAYFSPAGTTLHVIPGEGI